MLKPGFIIAVFATCVLTACGNDTEEQKHGTLASTAPHQSTERELPRASIEIPQSPEERKLLSGVGCSDEKTCFTFDKFDRHILAAYQDINRFRYRIPPDVDADAETGLWMRQDFHRALYFAKQIHLANGQTLFDFIKNCSRGFSPTDFAQIDRDPKTGVPFISMQYFPVLRQKGTGNDLEMQILLDRHGEQIQARSLFFHRTCCCMPTSLIDMA